MATGVLQDDVEQWLDERGEEYGDEWHISFSDGATDKTTTIAGLAFYADQYDDAATVRTV